jgi:regulator of protease activity HflC (stomatin/prohibitin superfamily)
MKLKNINMRAIAIVILAIIISFSGNAQERIKYNNETYITGVRSAHDEISALSKDLIMLNIEYTYLTLVKEDDIPFIHNNYGPDYNEKVCLPVIHSTILESFSGYTVEDIFSPLREELMNELFEISRNALQEQRIILKGLYVRDIGLPPAVLAAMEEKLLTQQEILAQQNRIKIAEMDAERKRIEAESIAAYNRILDSSLTEKVLQMKYIETLSELAKSQNSKVIVIDGNKPELPVILDKDQ